MNILSLKYKFKDALNHEFAFMIKQTSIMLVLISTGMALNVVQEILSSQTIPLEWSIVNEIITHSLVAVLSITAIYYIGKFTLKSFASMVIRAGRRGDQSVQPDIFRWDSWFFDVYLMASGVLAFFPIRPILQERYFEQAEYTLKFIFVSYNSFAIVGILSVFGICTALVMFKVKSEQKVQKIIVMALVLLLTVYSARTRAYENSIAETRAKWAARDYAHLFEAAERALNDAKSLPDKAAVYFWMGVAKNRAKQPDQALPYLEKSVELNPKYAEAYASLSTAYSGVGSFDKALIAADKCIQLQPQYGWCYFAKGLKYLSQKNIADGMYWQYVAVQIEPNDKEIRNAVAANAVVASQVNLQAVKDAKIRAEKDY